jgi:hypothetical protein
MSRQLIFPRRAAVAGGVNFSDQRSVEDQDRQ